MEDSSDITAISETNETNQDLVQIKAANEDEIHRRIDGFIRNKRSEVDERNVREFISPFSADIGESCARVEAVYVRREGQKSHITLKRVDNAYGPQTQQPATDYESNPFDHRLPLDLQRREAVEERITNMEAHLQLQAGGEGLYQRIKNLEERIMFLEGLSLEYFASIPQSKKATLHWDEYEERRLPSQPQSSRNESLSSINTRIEQLKQILKSKSEKRNDTSW